MVLCIFLCVVLHEFGHALAARRYGIGTRDITLLPIGGVARLERMPERPMQEFVVAVAGPAVNVVIAAILAGGLLVVGMWPTFDALTQRGGGFVFNLMAVNVLLVAFNMIPAFPMDGGRVLRALLATRVPYARATRIAATVGQVCAVGFGLVGLWSNPVLVLVAVFVFLAAQQEAQAAETRSLIQGLRVRDALMSEVEALEARDTIAHAARRLLAGPQTEFPVMDDGRCVGLLTRERIIEALARNAGDDQASAWVVSEGRRFGLEMPLTEAVAAMAGAGSRAACVFDGDRLVGMVTSENMQELMMMRAARRRAGSARFGARPEPSRG
jgi:Zn-dependent protease